MITLLMLGDSLVEWGDWQRFLPGVAVVNRGFAGEMTGELRITREACSGDSWKMLRSAPRHTSSDITMASRSGSIGGLVTWANC